MTMSEVGGTMFVLCLKGWAGISQENGVQEDGTTQG